MNELISGTNAITAGQSITSDLYMRFIAFIDAKPKTVETYARALKQFFKWLSSKNIVQPERADIIAFRKELRQMCKPATVQPLL